MSCIDLMKSDVWSEADILAHGRAVIDAAVPPQRRQELQTIMLGHIAGMRTATPAELAEIAQVQAVTEAVAVQNEQARADMALLSEALAVEAGTVELGAASQAAQALYALRHPAQPAQGETTVQAPSAQQSATIAPQEGGL